MEPLQIESIQDPPEKNTASFSNQNEFIDYNEVFSNPYCQISCVKCNIIFNSRVDFHQHYATVDHHQAISKSAPIGEEVSQSESNYPKICCPLCEKTFTLITDFNNHGSICREEFQSNFALGIKIEEQVNGHETFEEDFVSEEPNIKSNEDRLPCSECGKTYKTQRLLAKHISNFHSCQNYTCEKCGKNYSNLRRLKSHQLKPCNKFNADKQTEVDTPSKSCPKCGKDFQLIHELKNHLKNVCIELKLGIGGAKRCPYCPYMVSKSESLEIHVSDFHKEKLENHMCNICNKFFSKLRGHKRDVHSEEYVTCELCGKTMKSVRRLHEHQKFVHFKEVLKQFKCELCDYTNAKKYMVEKHAMVVHEGIKSHVCSVCGKCFSNKGNLDKHCKAIHEQSRCNICQHCGKGFSDIQNMQKHVLSVHEGCKPIKCPTCCRHYPKQESLDRHILRGCDGKKRKSRARVVQ